MRNLKNQHELFNSEQLVSNQDGKAMTSSLQIAKHFNKRHSDVLRDIKLLDCSDKFKERNFASSFYIRELDGRGQHKYPMYYMTKDGFSFLVMGFTGKQAAKFKEDYIHAFNAMEEFIRGQLINEIELSSYILESVNKNADMIKEYARVLSKRYGYSFELRTPDAIIKPSINSKKNIINNIEVLLSCYRNTLLAGLFQTYLAYEYDRRLKEVKLYVSKFIQNAPSSIDMY